MTRAALTLLLLLGGFGGCAHAPVTTSPDEVLLEVVGAYEVARVEFRGFHPVHRATLAKRFAKEIARTVKLDGPLGPGREVVRYVVHDTDRLGVPPLTPGSPLDTPCLRVVGLCQELGDSTPKHRRYVIHLAGKDPIRALRHEREHARSSMDHEGPKWEEIEKERFAKEWVGE